jgi:hypothetical protein
VRFSDLDLRVQWILVTSAASIVLGLGILIVLELLAQCRHARIQPPFYIHGAALMLLKLGVFLSVTAGIVLGLSVLRD